MTPIPYKGTPEAMQEVVAGRTHIMVIAEGKDDGDGHHQGRVDHHVIRGCLYTATGRIAALAGQLNALADAAETTIDVLAPAVGCTVDAVYEQRS
jgi:hypothetical protein